MPIPALRTLINWRLLALHLLAVFCLTMGVRQFMLIQIVDVITAYQKAGLPGVQQLDLTGRWDSTSKMFAYMAYVTLLPSTLAELIGCSLSWGVVTRLRERRAIPAIVFLTNVLVSRLGLYRTPAVTEIEAFMRWSLSALSLTTQLWVMGIILTATGLLLVLSPLLFQKRLAVLPANAQL